MSKDLQALKKKLQQIQSKFSDIEQAYQELQAKFEHVDQLYAISSRFGAIIDLDQLHRFIENLFTKQIQVDSYHLVRLKGSDNSAHLLLESDHSKMESEFISVFIAELLERGMTESIEVKYIRNLAEWQNPSLNTELKGCLLALPLLTDEIHITGYLLLYREAMNAFSVREQNLLEKISVHLAYALSKTLLYEHTKALSITDSLTGIYNRRHFTQRFDRELQRSKRYHRSVSLILLDIDHFKHYNDLNGHLKGDVILTQIAEILVAQLRKADIVARYGGEEFIILLPETNKEQAIQVAEKLRLRIEQEKFDYGGKQPDGRITASLGIAACPDDAAECELLIHLADQALYSAKSGGRNCVVAYGKNIEISPKTAPG